MAYVGGKARRCEHILSVLNHPAFDGMDYLEPFVGYAHILRRVENKHSYVASDVNKLLVTLLRGIQQGKKAPYISRAEYERLKTSSNDISFRRAVAAFAYSYKGKEFTGYFDDRPERGRMYAEEHKRYYDKLHNNEIFQDATIRAVDYRNLSPHDSLIYCDPPYRATTGYNGGADFDNDEFWENMRRWSGDNIVFVSEYRAPRDFRCVTSCDKLNNLDSTGKPSIRRERLFVHESTLPHIRDIVASARRRAQRCDSYRGRNSRTRETRTKQKAGRCSSRRTVSKHRRGH